VEENNQVPARKNRLKLSTTVSPQTDQFLKSLVKQGKAGSLAEAVDRAVAVARRADSRKRLEEATAAYYDSLSGQALKEEQALERAITSSSKGVDFDGE
jgi:hypothetical protein